MFKRKRHYIFAVFVVLDQLILQTRFPEACLIKLEEGKPLSEMYQLFLMTNLATSACGNKPL